MAATAGHSVAWRIPDDLLGAFCRVNHVALEPTGRRPLDGLAFATFNGCPLGLSVVGRRGAALDLLECTASVMAHTV